MKTTLKDIADATGVSIAAVSKVLNEKDIRISEKKRRQILITAENMNYRVNQAARTLVTKRSGLIGLIVPDIENPYFSRLAKHLEKRCLEQDRVLLILNSNEQAEGDLRLLDLLIDRQVEGIFFCPSFEAFHDQRVERKLAELSLPLVQIDRALDSLSFSKIIFDNEQGAYQATNHLLSKGHKNIGIIAPPQIKGHPSSRLQGYLRALKEKDIMPKPSWVYHGDYGYNSGYEGGKVLLKAGVSGVFSCNDRMTLGFLKALRESHKTIPRDLSLISNDHIAQDFTFGLAITTVIQDAALLANHSFDAYLKLIEEGKTTTALLTPTFVERESVSSPKKISNR